MNRTITIAPVRKSIIVQAGTERAFNVFTAGIDRWWPKDKGIGVGPVRVWQPFEVEQHKRLKEYPMSEFNIHSVPGSPFGRAALLALEEKGVGHAEGSRGVRRTLSFVGRSTVLRGRPSMIATTWERVAELAKVA